MKRLPLILFMLLNVSWLKAQETVNIVDVLGIHSQMDSLEQRINVLIQRSSYLRKVCGLKRYYVFNLCVSSDDALRRFCADVRNVDGIRCLYSDEMCSDDKLIKKKRNDRYISVYAIVCDSCDNVLAVGDCRKLKKINVRKQHGDYDYEKYCAIVKCISKHTITTAFKLFYKTSYELLIGDFNVYGIADNSVFDLKFDYPEKRVILGEAFKGLKDGGKEFDQYEW